MKSLALGVFSLLIAATCGAAQPAAEPIRTPVTANGLVAALYTPAGAHGRLPGIIIFGGSEGGMGKPTARDGRLIAQRGYAVLQLAYFDAPGLPKDLALIPVEYFKTAIDWLRTRPDVDPDRIGIVGGSIGGEVALTVASHNREIRAVVAAMPSSVVWPGIIHTPGDPPSTFTTESENVGPDVSPERRLFERTSNQRALTKVAIPARVTNLPVQSDWLPRRDPKCPCSRKDSPKAVGLDQRGGQVMIAVLISGGG